MAGEAWSLPEPCQSDATNIIFLSRAVFVCSVVSRWCVCVVRGVLLQFARPWNATSLLVP